jgi:succinoglycan biosynthesis protein ExoM
MPRIVILICTCDRPQLLERLLHKLWPQAIRLDAPIVVIDNGRTSSQHIVAGFEPRVTIHYERLSSKGLANARNASLRAALQYSPDLLAFIDDDEIPTDNWLQSLVLEFETTRADVIVGPVEAEYVSPPAGWVTAGRFFEKSGDTLCTSNLLLNARKLPASEADWFRQEFNLTGGEDNEFLNRLVAGGATQAVAAGAIVREVIPPERMTLAYICRRGFRDGVVITQTARLRESTSVATFVTVTREATMKLGYALNHLFWSVKEPWRLAKALGDVSSTIGMYYCILGFRSAMYGAK